MSLLLLGDSEFGIRQELFAQNEQGLHLDPAITESARTWRRNLLTYSEGTIARFTVKDQVSDAVTTISGFDNSIYFTDNSILRFCHAVLTTTVGVSHTFSIYVQMDDNSVPVPGSTTTTGDFSLIALGNLQSDVTVTLVSGSLYRLSKTFTGDGTSKNFGIVKYTGQSAKGFRVTGYQVEVGSLTAYQPITDFSTEFKAAFPTHTIYQDSAGVAPVTAPGDLVGLVLDQRQGALTNLGAELTTNGGFDSDTWWTKSINVTITGGVCQYSSVALNNGVFRSGIVTAGRFYRIEFTVSGFSSGGVRVYLGGTRTTAVSANGTYTYIMPAGSSDTQIIFEATSAGTILALDNISVREVPGNHAYQSTSGARPTLGRVPFGGRRNLLTRSEELDNVAWTKPAATITANATAAFNGELIADEINEGTTVNFHQVQQLYTFTTSQTVTLTCDFKYIDRPFVNLAIWSSSGTGLYASVCFDIQNGTVQNSGAVGAGYAVASSGVESLGDGWYRCRATLTPGTTAANTFGFAPSDDGTISSYGLKSYLGTSKKFYATRIQLETGSTATTYQRVTSTHDVTQAGQPDCWYLDTSGSKWMQTNAIDFTGTTSETRRNRVSASEHYGLPWNIGVASATYGELGPEGLYNATTFTVNPAGAQTHVQNGISYVASQPHVLTFWIKGGTATTANIGMYANAAFLSQTGTKLSGPGAISGTGLQGISGLVAGQWTKFQITFTAPASGNLDLYFYGETSGIKTGLSQSIAQFQLELGSTPTAYQPTGTDEMTVIAGVRKLSDAATGIIAEFSATITGNNGTFWLVGPTSVVADYGFRSKGTVIADADLPNIYAAPRTDVLTGLGDISSDICTLRLNGSATTVATDQGSGNFGNHILYLFSRAGTGSFFNGHFFHLIIRGKTTEGSKLTGAEKLTARKTGTTI